MIWNCRLPRRRVLPEPAVLIPGGCALLGGTRGQRQGFNPPAAISHARTDDVCRSRRENPPAAALAANRRLPAAARISWGLAVDLAGDRRKRSGNVRCAPSRRLTTLRPRDMPIWLDMAVDRRPPMASCGTTRECRVLTNASCCRTAGGPTRRRRSTYLILPLPGGGGQLRYFPPDSRAHGRI